MTHLPSGFVRADGRRLVDDDGPLLLRGVGIGNWLLPEGYMWLFGDEMSSPWQIEARIESLVGPDRAADFWRRFHDTFFTERDVELIAAAGFDHIRLPFNARLLMDADGAVLEHGFALIHRAVEWSRTHGLRVLLDLHGAPGGQTGTNIDDSRHGRPELFMHDRFRAQTIALWEEIARRYRDDQTVLGYDLLNEPLPNEWQYTYNDELVELYRDLTAAIRAIDDRHLLMYEGSHWATNWTPLSERFDDNQALQFHRYWCAPDHTSIQPYLDARDALDTPIYMGEGGENTPAWIYAATRLYERHDIGWNLWPWKKLDTVTSPLSVRPVEGWELISDPTLSSAPDRAQEVLDAFLTHISADRCEVRRPVLDALFARPALDLPAWAGVRPGGERAIDDLAGGSLPPGIWAHTAGAAYSDDEAVGIPLEAGAEVVFAFAEPPGQWTVSATPAAAVIAQRRSDGLVLRAEQDAVVHGVSVSP